MGFFDAKFKGKLSRGLKNDITESKQAKISGVGGEGRGLVGNVSKKSATMVGRQRKP